MAPSSASLTTFFVVGPEEYVEFAESMGSKAFLQHIWDNAVTPLSRKDLDSTPRLHATGARVVRPENGPPRIEFPTVKRLRGNRYKPTGKWISWQALKRLNPLAITDPPDLNVFLARGGTVGTGERRAPGAFLEQTTSKNLIPFAVPEEPDASTQETDAVMESQSYLPNGTDASQPVPTAGTATPPRVRTNKPSLNTDSQGWIGIGSAQSIHAPPRAVVVRRARQTSSPAALAAKAALAASAGRPGPSPLANPVGGENATLTPANAHLLRSTAATSGSFGGAASPSGSNSSASTATPVGTPPARTAPRLGHGASQSISSTPSPSATLAGTSARVAASTPPPGSSSSQPSTPGSSGSTRANRRPNLRVPMPPPQNLSSSFRNGGGTSMQGQAGPGGSQAGGGGVTDSSAANVGRDVPGFGSSSPLPDASSSNAPAPTMTTTTGLTPGALTPGHAAGARTPLSATHPPPETPLKHQRRRAKETAEAVVKLAAAAAAAEAEAASGGRDGDSRRRYVDADDERDPMDFVGARVGGAGPSSSMGTGAGIALTMSPSGNPAGLGGNGANAGLVPPTSQGHSGSTPPDLSGLANLPRAEMERARLAFERTAAGQDPLLSASANARPVGPNGSPFNSLANNAIGLGTTGGHASNGGFGSWTGLGDWATAPLPANSAAAAAMAAAIADARRSSLPPLTPATEGVPYPGAMDGGGVAGGAAGVGAGPGSVGTRACPPTAFYDDGNASGGGGIGLGLETGPPVGRASRPSLYGSTMLDTPPNGLSQPASPLGLDPGARTMLNGPSPPSALQALGLRSGRCGNATAGGASAGTGTGSGNGAGSSSSDDLDDGTTALDRVDSDQGSSSLASSFQFVRLGGAPGPSSTAVLASSSPERERGPATR